MECQIKSIHPPVAQSQERANAYAAKSSVAASFGGLEAPAVVPLLSCGVNLPVTLFIVGLLVDHQSIHALSDEFLIGGIIHGIKFYGNGGEPTTKRFHRIQQIFHVNHLGGFSRYEKHVAKSLLTQMLSFHLHLSHRKGKSLHRVAQVEAAVYTGIGADIGQIKRGKKADHPAEPLLRESMRPLGHFFQGGFSCR